MSIRKAVIGSVVSMVMFGALMVPAYAAPGDNGNGNGGCVDNFYGNATNERPGGNGVLPSQSPGPWVNNPVDPENPTEGPSVGEVMQVTRRVEWPGIHGTHLYVSLADRN